MDHALPNASILDFPSNSRARGRSEPSSSIVITIDLHNLAVASETLLKIGAAVAIAQRIIDRLPTHGEAAVRAGINQVFSGLTVLLDE